MKICGSTDWGKSDEGECVHCLRLIINRTTIDGSVRKRMVGRVNYAFERRKIFKYYNRRRILIIILRHERRVLRSLARN